MVRVAEAAKHPEVIIGGWCAEQELEWGEGATSLTRPPVH
jgi:hypothetical protein